MFRHIFSAFLALSTLCGTAVGQTDTDALHRNYTACTLGVYGCNKNLLTTEQATQVQGPVSARTGAATSGTLSLPSFPNPGVGVAENGSYYGEPNANGVPKTVYVNGYYRKD